MTIKAKCGKFLESCIQELQHCNFQSSLSFIEKIDRYKALLKTTIEFHGNEILLRNTNILHFGRKSNFQL
jgi:hypothetical protein